MGKPLLYVRPDRCKGPSDMLTLQLCPVPWATTKESVPTKPQLESHRAIIINELPIKLRMGRRGKVMARINFSPVPMQLQGLCS